MNEKELSNYYYLKKEIENLEERIITFGVGVSSVKIKDLNVDSSPQYKSIQDKITELKDLWMEKRVSALEEYIKIEKYILSVPDEELRLIMRYRFMDLMKWEQIGNKMGYDRTSVAKKVRGWFKKYDKN